MSEDAPEAAVEAKLTALAERIADAEARLAAENAVDLSGLDELTHEVCTVVAELPAEQRDALRPRLEDMLAALDRVAELLQARDSSGEAADPARGGHTEAARAYARGAGTDRGRT